MITLLDAIGPAIWRASYQATALAIFVAVLLRCFGERMTPQWRFLLWSVVLARLLLVATPSSPWSAFNLANWDRAGGSGRSIHRESSEAITSVLPTPESTASRSASSIAESQAAETGALSGLAQARLPEDDASKVPPNAMSTEATLFLIGSFDEPFSFRLLTTLWLAGCLVMGSKLLGTAIILHRRLSACRPVTDAAALEILDACRRRLGLQRTPALLVSPGRLSPCIVGIWNPRIVLPESVLTDSTPERLRHVLAHELAHVVRGDLWSNWLLLAARVLHWFNPVSWWAVREMQAEREAACDELAVAALGATDRSAYAATIVELAATVSPASIAPGLIGLFSSAGRVNARVERLLRPAVPVLRGPMAAALVLSLAFLGLTDAMPGAKAQAPNEAAPLVKLAPKANDHVVDGSCVDDVSGEPLAGVTVRLYRVDGRTSSPVEIAKTITNADGRYAFAGLEPPRLEVRFDRLVYGVLGFDEKRPIGSSFSYFREDKQVFTVRMSREESTFAGKVVDAAGRPVVGATVLQLFVHDRPVLGLHSATTDADGRFEIENVAVYKPYGQTPPWPVSFRVLHPDHPEWTGQAKALQKEVVVTLPAGCIATGTVIDGITGKPAAGALVTARRTDVSGESFAATDAAGRFRLVALEGRYDFLVEAKDRVCIASTGHECLAGDALELPPFTLIGGGFISGRVVNSVTREPVSVSDRGKPITLGLFGPSKPAVGVDWSIVATVDETGRFILRAAPGENFPYFKNTRGDRSSWDTKKQPPIIVKEGETTHYDMLITPRVPPEDRLKAARELVDGLSKDPSRRTAQILLEFRRLNLTVDEMETWCLLMRELVALGNAAVPRVCAELDRTTENLMLRRLGFALRAIGDRRAVPALIRAIPKTHLPASSDFGLIVNDKELTEFMQTHDLSKGKKDGTYFDLGRPVREIIGALHSLTGQNFDDAELFNMHLSEDPRRQLLQRRFFQIRAQRWQAWWEQNWRMFTEDATLQEVKLNFAEEPLPPASQSLGKASRVVGETSEAILSPAVQQGQHARHFYDLDTGYQPFWPTQIPRDEAALDAKQLEDWASKNGVDLMCVTRRSPDGAETFVLRAFGMKVREISSRDLRNLDRLVAAGTLPEGRPVNELLIHYDPQTQQLIADANGAFLFVTREGSMGVIETTDRVTKTANLTGMAGDPPPGVGFFKGVRFNLKAIIP